MLNKNVGQEYPMFSDNGRAVVISRSGAHYKRDTSLVYCLEVLVSDEVTGFPFRLSQRARRLYLEKQTDSVRKHHPRIPHRRRREKQVGAQ